MSNGLLFVCVLCDQMNIIEKEYDQHNLHCEKCNAKLSVTIVHPKGILEVEISE